MEEARDRLKRFSELKTDQGPMAEINSKRESLMLETMLEVRDLLSQLLESKKK